MREQLSPESVLTLVGTIAVVVGSYLPWFRVDPLFDPLSTRFPEVYTTLADTGIHGVDLVLFGAVGAILLVQFVEVPERIRTLVPVLGGAAIALYTLHFLLLSPRVGFGGDVVPVVGWYLTLLGGLLLVATGLHRAVGGRAM